VSGSPPARVPGDLTTRHTGCTRRVEA